MDTITDHRMDAPTRAALRAYVARAGWRTAARVLGVSCGAIRRSLAQEAVRHTTIIAIRAALAIVQIGRTP